jgi:3-deoxy-7-phosphoheptulonate synthase
MTRKLTAPRESLDRTIVRVRTSHPVAGGAVSPLVIEFGGRSLPIIGGPCSVESREMLLDVAHAVRAAGASMLRGGAYKPRTSPYEFQGLGLAALELLAEARAATGLPVVTEVLDPRDVDLVGRYTDVYQVGARNMQNYALLAELGRADRPVLLKRGFAATVAELLMAAEHIMANGNANVILCERGIRTFETHTRFTLPLATVVYLHAKTHLPVVVDPSHGTGHTYLVPQMAAASVAAGADGLILEVHPDPASALSDGYQSLNFKQFEETMATCRKIAGVLGKQMA